MDIDTGDFTATRHFFLEYGLVVKTHDYSNPKAFQALFLGIDFKFISSLPPPLLAWEHIIAQLQASISDSSSVIGGIVVTASATGGAFITACYPLVPSGHWLPFGWAILQVHLWGVPPLALIWVGWRERIPMEQAMWVATSKIGIQTLWRQCLLKWFCQSITIMIIPYGPILQFLTTLLEATATSSTLPPLMGGIPMLLHQLLFQFTFIPQRCSLCRMVMPIRPLFWRFPFSPTGGPLSCSSWFSSCHCLPFWSAGFGVYSGSWGVFPGFFNGASVS